MSANNDVSIKHPLRVSVQKSEFPIFFLREACKHWAGSGLNEAFQKKGESSQAYCESLVGGR